MTKSKAEFVREEVNGYHPSMFFVKYEKYRRQFWLREKKRKVENEKNRNYRDKKKKYSRSL